MCRPGRQLYVDNFLSTALVSQLPSVDCPRQRVSVGADVDWRVVQFDSLGTF